MAAVNKWCDRRSIKQVYKFFQGCDNGLDQFEARIRLVLRTSEHTVNEADLPWLESMEATIAALPVRKTAA